MVTPPPQLTAAIEPEIDRCPFCGGAPIDYAIEPHTHDEVLASIMRIPDHPGSHWIECRACDIHIGRETRAAVIAAWNRRAERPQEIAASRAQVYLDEIDASIAAHEWIRSAALAQSSPLQIRSDRFEHDGGAITLWIGGHLAALSVILRNDANRSVLVSAKIRHD